MKGQEMEMSTLYTILAEVAFFGGLALLYYIIQKRRILNKDLENICFDLYEILEKELVSSEESEKKLAELNKVLQEKNFPEIFKLTDSLKGACSSDNLEKINSLIKSMQYHQK